MPPPAPGWPGRGPRHDDARRRDDLRRRPRHPHGELTRSRPKPLIEVAGRPLIAHALALARGAGIARVVVNIHAHAPMMRDWLAEHAPEVAISEEPVLLETGGGLASARPLLGAGPVLTLNADMVWRGPNPSPRSSPPGTRRGWTACWRSYRDRWRSAMPERAISSATMRGVRAPRHGRHRALRLCRRRHSLPGDPRAGRRHGLR